MAAGEVRERKRALRRMMVARILALDPDMRRREETILAARFATLPGLAEAETILLYVTAFPEEIATGPLLDQSLAWGKRLLCPRVDRVERRLRLFRIDDPKRDLTSGTLGIPEPRLDCTEVEPGAVDWVLVPGLAFDAHGYRLGRGAGHYDRLLPTLRADVPCWALTLDCKWVEDLPVEPHDIPLDGLVSPSKEIHRGGRRERRKDGGGSIHG